MGYEPVQKAIFLVSTKGIIYYYCSTSTGLLWCVLCIRSQRVLDLAVYWVSYPVFLAKVCFMYLKRCPPPPGLLYRWVQHDVISDHYYCCCCWQLTRGPWHNVISAERLRPWETEASLYQGLSRTISKMEEDTVIKVGLGLPSVVKIRIRWDSWFFLTGLNQVRYRVGRGGKVSRTSLHKVFDPCSVGWFKAKKGKFGEGRWPFEPPLHLLTTVLYFW